MNLNPFKHTNYKILTAFFVISFLSSLLSSQTFQEDKITFYNPTDAYMWVDTTFSKMTLDEKLGQLFMIAAYSNKDAAHERAITNLIEKENIGGLIFFKKYPTKQIQLLNRYQTKSKIPLLIGMDAEWGLAMRLDSTIKYPHQLTLGAIQDNEKIKIMGAQIAEQMKIVGTHVNFAPVVDVNNNALNPVINNRSFGENKYNVALKGLAYAEGLQEAGAMACAKHFPGHGDTDTDSHKDLPIITHTRERLDSLELYPFRVMTQQGIQSMMVAHLYVPSLDDTPNMATTLSPKVIKDLLINEIGFRGLIFTDALNMQGVRKFFAPGEVDQKALIAGNDILLYSEDVTTAKTKIKAALEDGSISMDQVERSVKKVLYAKFYQGLSKWTNLSTENVNETLNKAEYKAHNRKLYLSAITLAKNDSSIVPIKDILSHKVATVVIGSTKKNNFQRMVDNYARADHFYISKNASQAQFTALNTKLSKYNLVLISIENMSRHNSKNYGITQISADFVNKLSKEKQTIVSLMGSPYSLKYFNDCTTILVAYEDNNHTQEGSAMAIFGGIGVNGKLPVSANEQYKEGMGLSTTKGRLSYGRAEDVGFNPEYIRKINSVAYRAISAKATPGCQILAIKDGQVFINKSYGYHTYDKKRRVRKTDLYDIASVTKLAATTLSLMKLTEEGKLDVYGTLGTYLPKAKGTNKENLVISEMLTHTAKLAPWIPFYVTTIEKDSVPGFKDSIKVTLNEKMYKETKTRGYTIPVAEDIFLKSNYPDSIYYKIFKTKLRSEAKYKYSDLGFYLFPLIIESLTEKGFEEYVNNTFYKPLGLGLTTYNPYKKFSKRRTPPSEEDNYYRNQVVQGRVHDMGAAMLGGVSGHAGLFSNANNLGVIMQMLLDDGNYGYKDYLRPETINEFTRRQNEDHRRGLGFDKPETDPDKGNPAGSLASPSTFGHTGFTGTCVWADPQEKIVYIFLSNRTFPTMENKKMVKGGYRTRIHNFIYEGFSKPILTIKG